VPQGTASQRASPAPEPIASASLRAQDDNPCRWPHIVILSEAKNLLAPLSPAFQQSIPPPGPSQKRSEYLPYGICGERGENTAGPAAGSLRRRGFLLPYDCMIGDCPALSKTVPAELHGWVARTPAASGSRSDKRTRGFLRRRSPYASCRLRHPDTRRPVSGPPTTERALRVRRRHGAGRTKGAAVRRAPRVRQATARAVALVRAAASRRASPSSAA